MRRKCGFAISEAADDDLDALSFALGESRSRLVEQGLELQREKLTREQRERFEAARRARRGV